jgi:predicted ArsR family transcriptional regulator
MRVVCVIFCASHEELSMSVDVSEFGRWTFLSNHAHVLLCLARDSTMRIRDMALEVGITERAVQKIISDLAAAGYVKRVRTGRRNSYRIDKGLHLRHPIEQHKTIADLIRTIHGQEDITAPNQ